MSFLTAEYDYDMDIQVNREEAFEDGVKQGIEQGIVLFSTLNDASLFTLKGTICA